MASLYAVAGTTWDGTGTTWATSDGGAPTASDPTMLDDVFFTASSGPGPVTLSGTADCNSITCTGYTGRIDGTASLTVYGNTFTLSSTMTYVLLGTVTFQSNAGTTIITSATQTMDHNVVFGGIGGTFQLADTMTVGTSSTTTLTYGTLDFNTYNLSTGIFVSNGAATRVLTMGSSTCYITWASYATTVIDFSTTTNLTFTANTATFSLTGNTASARTIQGGSITTFPSISISAGSGSIVTTNVNCFDYTQTSGYTGAKANNAMTIRGSISLNAANGTPTAGANAWTLTSTSGTKTIASGGKTCDFPFTFDGVGGTWQLTSNLTIGSTRTTTLTNGTLDLNSLTLATGAFSSNNANTRVLTFGSGSGILDLTSATSIFQDIFDLTSVTGLTVNNPTTGLIKVSGAATADRQLLSVVTLLLPSVTVSNSGNSTSYVSLRDGMNVYNLTFTSGFTALPDLWINSVRGNFAFNAANGTPRSGGTVTFAATSGTKTIDFAGKVNNCDHIFDGVGGTWQLLSNMTNGSAYITTLTNGALDFNTYNLSTGRFLSDNANTRVLTMGSSTCSITWDTLSATVVAFTTTTGLTFTANTGTFSLTGVIANARTIDGGSITTFPSISISAGSGSIVTTNVNCLDYTQTSGYTGAKANSSMTIRGSISLNAANGTPTAGTGIWTLASTSGTKTIDSGGKTCNFPFTFDGVGGTWQLTSNLRSGAARTTSLTSGALNLNTFTHTCGFFLGVANATTKSLTFGTGGKIDLGATGTVWISNVGSNYTINGTGGTIDLNGIAGAVSRTVSALATHTNMPSLAITGGSSTGTVTITGYVQPATASFSMTPGSANSGLLTMTGSCEFGSFTTGSTHTGGKTCSTSTLKIKGNYSSHANNGNWTSATGIITFEPQASSTLTIASASNTWGNIIDIIALDDAGIVQLSDSFTGSDTTRYFRISRGTLNLNTFAMTVGYFVIQNNLLTRGITFGSSILNLNTVAAQTVWSQATSTTQPVYTYTTGYVNINGANTLTRTIVSTTSTVLPKFVISNGSGAFSTTTCKFDDITFAPGWTGSSWPNTTQSYNGDFTVTSTTGTFTPGTGVMSFTTSGSKYITMNSGRVLDRAVTIAASGGTITLQNSNLVCTNYVLTHSTGTLNLGTVNAIFSSYVSTGSNTRSLQFNSQSLVLTLSVGNVWNTSTASNMTISTTGTVQLTGSSAISKTLTSTSGQVLLPSVTVSGSGPITLTSFSCSGTLTLDAAVGAYALSSTSTTPLLGGGLIVSGVTTTCSTSLIFDATSGSYLISISATSWGGTSHTFGSAASTATWTFILGCTFTGTVNIIAGTVDLGLSIVRSLTFTSTGTLSRTLNVTSSTLELSSTSPTTVFDVSGTNISFTGSTTGTIKLIGVTASTRVISGSASEVDTYPSVSITAGSGAITFTNFGSGSNAIAGLTLGASYSGTIANQNIRIAGSLSIAAGCTLTGGANEWNLCSASGGTITVDVGRTLDFPITVDATSQTYTLASDLVVGSTRTLTLTQGTIDAVTYAVTAGTFSSDNSNTRTLNLGTGTWTTTSSGTSWNCSTGTGLTIVPSTSTVKMTGTSVTFEGGSKTYHNLWFSAGSTTYTVAGSNTFADLRADP